METNNLILVSSLCSVHQIEFSFVNSLQELGLVQLIEVEEQIYISVEQLRDFEKMIQFHFELNINIEGIEVIANLLKQIDTLQQDLT
ncbi:MAG: MerR family transcriptional regulator, partial [Bacteroidetes bacterium]|nr:MerR family transcriptional regulator [Bacteroidota bacterium]